MKNKKVKVISIIMITILVIFNITSIYYVGVSAEEDEVYVGDFNLYEYRADLYLNDSVFQNSISYLLTCEYPSKNLVDYANNETSLPEAAAAWKAVHFATSPSEIANGGIDAKGYYTAIILSIFKAQSDNSDVISDCVEKVNSDTNKILSNMKKWVKESDQIELDKISRNQIISTISPEDQKLIRTYLSSEFKNNHPVLDNASTISSDIATIFSMVDTLGEAIELMESYIQIYEMADGMKAVLLDMYEHCPSDNVNLQSALYEATLSSENLNGALSATIINTAGKETVNVVGTLLDEGWSALIKSNPYAGAFMIGAEVGTWLGDTICNTLFSTDKTVEQYYKMMCLDDVMSLLRGTVKNMGNTYLNNKSTVNAENYFASIDALFSGLYLSCDFAKEYAEILYGDATLTKLWADICKVDYKGFLASVQDIKNIYQSDEKSLINLYKNDLEADYPDIYNILFGNASEEYIAVTGISFTKDSMVVGLNDDYFYFMEKPTISPANATNQHITYSSSDNTIVGIDEKGGYLSLKKAGTVTITATSEDGGYTCSMEITVTGDVCSK